MRLRKSPSATTRKRCSDSLKRAWQEKRKCFSCGPEHARIVGQQTVGKFKGQHIRSILEVSSRTAAKILKRLQIGCSICGWKEAACDIHHINGRKVADAQGHWNLTCVCPNHHRIIHDDQIDKSKLIPLNQSFPKNWQESYYG